MPNPYDPPSPPNDDEDREESPFDEHWVGRECFGWICLLLTVFYLLDTLVHVVKEYYGF